MEIKVCLVFLKVINAFETVPSLKIDTQLNDILLGKLIR